MQWKSQALTICETYSKSVVKWKRTLYGTLSVFLLPLHALLEPFSTLVCHALIWQAAVRRAIPSFLFLPFLIYRNERCSLGN